MWLVTNGHLLSSRPQQYRLTIEDIEIVRKIGNGICGEVFLMRHKASRFEMAAKVCTANGSIINHGCGIC